MFKFSLFPLKGLKEEMTLIATSYSQTKIEIDQHLQEKGISIQDIVAKNMNKRKNKVELSFVRQHESLPSLPEVIREENLSYNEDITSRINEELEELTRGDDDA